MDHEMMPRSAMLVQPSGAVGTSISAEKGISLGKELIAGMQAGVGAAYAMGLTAMVVVWIHNWSTWAPFNDVASSLIPSLAGIGDSFNFGAVLVSSLVHFIVSIALGLVFAILYGRVIRPHFNDGVPVLAGFVFGMLTWTAARFTVVPFLGSEIYGSLPFLVVHLVFGATLGLLYPVMPGLKRRG